MKEAVRVTDGIYWVGAIDWNVRNFHGYTTPRGTTYNAYLITGEKNILVDTVKKPFYGELVERISSVIDPKRIDLIVSNHTEMDHSGALPEMQKLTGAKILASRMGVEGLNKHYPGLDVEMVKDGSEIQLGGKTLKFIDTPMLHWPDSMFTYVEEDKLLFSMDAFGQHYATTKRFADEVDQDVLFQEAAKYYANIILPFNARVLKTVEKAQELDIQILATSHGAIWRKDLGKIVQLYTDWANNRTKEKAIVVYDTMWGSTRIMAEDIAEGIASEGPEVTILKLTDTDRSMVMKELLDSRAVVVGTPTLNNSMFPSVADMVTYMKGLRPKDRLGAVFGSYGWSSGAVQAARELMKMGGLDMPFGELTVQWVPSVEERKQCREYGRTIGRKVMERKEKGD
ncbi:FprA family A-type flavoprotein [Methanomassiliicoccus luminyensis]|uniref:FprA family A-type flavoprotein n=1 Tax=Methanomassiliicoccus luminyensis TaxID=1080712 RepID=UPI00035DF99B|nr:FprA family A-type flavoprotein [Methanomassiliicoccus luminyensis]